MLSVQLKEFSQTEHTEVASTENIENKTLPTTQSHNDAPSYMKQPSLL